MDPDALFNMMAQAMRPRTQFEQQYRAFSVLMCPGQAREDVERGGKIIMPPSALDMLTRLNIQYPMLFKLTNDTCQRVTHSGVLEFVAEEGRVYLPSWMMQNMLLREGDIITIRNAALQLASYCKFQPQSPDFLDITDPKAVLERALRLYATLTEGDIIAIPYNGKIYDICVLEVKPKDPSKAVSIIECDVQLEFEKPLGYIEPDYKAMQAEKNAAELQAKQEAAEAEVAAIAAEVEAEVDAATAPAVFVGAAHRLDGRPVGDDGDATANRVSSTSSSSSNTSAGSKCMLAEAAAARRARAAARAAAAEQRFVPGKLSFASAPAPPPSQGDTDAADAAAATETSDASMGDGSTQSDEPKADPFQGKAYRLR